MMDIEQGPSCVAPTLMGEKIILRPTRDEDYETLRRHRSDAELYRYIRPPESEEQTRKVHRDLCLPWNFVEHRWNGLMICEKSNPDRAIGEVVFNVCNAYMRHIELGYLVEQGFSGKGYASDAARCLLDHLFATTNCHKIIAHVDPRNQPSVHILQKLGMALEGKFRSHYRNGDEWTDQWSFGLLRSDWHNL